MHILLLANGELKRGVMLDRLLHSLESTRVICADGGALHARALGLRPHTIIGDLDSLTAEQVAEFEAAGAVIIQHPAEKNETDLELALYHCRHIDAKTVNILGGLGGRFDQTLANIFLLMLPALRDIHIEVVDGDQKIKLLRPGTHDILARSGDMISLIPLSAAEDISTRDLQYPLKGETLRFGRTRGISNVVVGNRPAIRFKHGLLLLVHTCGLP